MKKKYIVKWKNETKEFADVREAVSFAERTGVTSGSNAYVYTEINGVREEEPFFYCESII